MTKDEALRLALDFIGRLKFADAEPEPERVMDDIKQALEQPEPQPVAWTDEMARVPDHVWGKPKPLTDKQIYKIANDLFYGNGPCDTIAMCRAIEQAHGIGEKK